MNLNGAEYFYVRNAQGDIVGLLDIDGVRVVSYAYDSWGKLISTTDTSGADVGVKNPYRYRGYRYDNETGLYYLNSRYYNADWGRFINADIVMGKVGELLSHNMFSYCDNNPINREDHDGHFWGFIATAISAVFIPVEIVVVAAVVTVATIGWIGYMAYDWYSRTHVQYADSSGLTVSSNSNSQSSSNSSNNSSNSKTGTNTKPTVNVNGRKKWKSRPLPKGFSIGNKKLPSRDMVKKPVIDSNGNQIGEMHIWQPEYNYNSNGTKTPTGRFYPEHYHLNGDSMHYLP